MKLFFIPDFNKVEVAFNSRFSFEVIFFGAMTKNGINIGRASRYDCNIFHEKVTNEIKGATATVKLACPCGFTKTCNMSGDAHQAANFNQLVTENIMVHNLNVHSTQKFLKGINMCSKNLQGTVSGLNLEKPKMAALRNQLYVDIINRKSQIEDEMLAAVINSSDCPTFSFDAFYSDV